MVMRDATARSWAKVVSANREQRNATLEESYMATSFDDLVDAENGLVSRRIFMGQEIYAQELQRIFARCWLFPCRESQVPQPGRFFTTYMGQDPVLVRDTAGKVCAFLNVCMQVRLRHECLNYDLRMSECNHGQFYRRWAQLMAADRQAQVATYANGGCEATT